MRTSCHRPGLSAAFVPAPLGIVIAMGQNYGFANGDLWNWMRVT